MRLSVPITLISFLILKNASYAMIVPPFQPGLKIHKEQGDTSAAYEWKDFHRNKSIQSKIKLKICSAGVCKAIIKAPKLDQLIIDQSGAYVVGLSYSRDAQQQLFVWDKYANSIAKKTVDCEKIPSCCFISDGPLIFWFSPKIAAEAKVENGALKLRIPEFKEMECSDKEVGSSTSNAYFEMNVPIPIN